MTLRFADGQLKCINILSERGPFTLSQLAMQMAARPSILTHFGSGVERKRFFQSSAAENDKGLKRFASKVILLFLAPVHLDLRSASRASLHLVTFSMESLEYKGLAEGVLLYLIWNPPPPKLKDKMTRNVSMCASVCLCVCTALFHWHLGALRMSACAAFIPHLCLGALHVSLCVLMCMHVYVCAALITR